MFTLRDFCRYASEETAPGEMNDPEFVGSLFRHFFGLPPRPSRDRLIALLEEDGMGTVSSDRLPANLREIHFSVPEGGYDVCYSEGQWKGAQEHTLLHETYEIFHETLSALVDGHVVSRSVCSEADRFAAATLMRPDLFTAFARASGLDVVETEKFSSSS